MTNHFIDNHIQPLDLSQENANLRDLLNASMVENAALLQQVTEMQEALDGTQALWMASMVKCEALGFELNNASKERDDLREMVAMENEKLARMVDATMQRRAENAEAQYTTLLTWSQAAYKRLGGLMTIGVSMTPDAVTARLLSDAPANVSAEVDPFSATLDATYSIYTDPLIVGVAEGLDCTVDELMEYAADSVGAPITKMEGCHSAGLHSCYGELWTCTGCGNRFCGAEGSDNMPELCNDCWWKAKREVK